LIEAVGVLEARHRCEERRSPARYVWNIPDAGERGVKEE